MNISEYFNRDTLDCHDKLYTLRNLLLEKGYIKDLKQKYVYASEAKRFILEWYLNELARQDALRSTGSWGKQFEVESRIAYSIARNTPFCINDAKCRPAGLRDMTIRLNGANYSVEIKTGGGAVGYGPDKASAHESLVRFFKGNPIIVWDYNCNGEPLVMKAKDLLEVMYAYKHDIEGWFVDNPNYDKLGNARNRSYQIQFSLTTRRREYLDEIRAKSSITWAELIEGAEWHDGEED